jgi:hypothetical protein
MPRWTERTRFELGDEVSNGEHDGVVVWSDFPSRGTGAHFLVVKSPGVTGRKPLAAYPWRPLLDYDDGTNRYQCASCDREYKAGASRGWCRQCVRKDEAAHANRNTGSSTFSRVGAAPRFEPAPVRAKATDEQRERVERGRVSSDEGEPF